MDKPPLTPENSPTLVSKQVLFFGRVQGVGFRYTVRSLAESFPIGGYVMNLTDGSVELLAEGSADQVVAFIDAVRQRMADHIEEIVEREQDYIGHEGFTIRH